MVIRNALSWVAMVGVFLGLTADSAAAREKQTGLAGLLDSRHPLLGEGIPRDLLGILGRIPGAPHPDATGIIVDRGGRYRVRRLTDLAYRAGPRAHPKKHRLDLSIPEGVRAFPMMVFIHGGGWFSGDKRVYRNVGTAFAREGFGVAVINYRLVPDAVFPGQATDAAGAVAWVYRNASRFGGDPARFFLSGHSAGGHLAALLALDRSWLRAEGLTGNEITGVLPVSGVYRIRANMFGAFPGGPEVWRRASPVNHARADAPPFHVMVGEHDAPTLGPDARALVDALRKAGGSPRHTVVTGRRHLNIISRVGRSGDETTELMLKFMRGMLSASREEAEAAPR